MPILQLREPLADKRLVMTRLIGHFILHPQAGDEVWGYVVHNHVVQFARPAVVIEFNVVRVEALQARKGGFDGAADNFWVVAAE